MQLPSSSPASDPVSAPSRALGVYVHFPWCLKKCPYCDFLSVAIDRDIIPHVGYADTVIAELERRMRDLEGQELASIFFGGGTPSLWAPRELGRVLDAILRAFRARADEIEITVECNPTSFDEERGRALRDLGVNRVSIGVQGLDTARLSFLGRLHDANAGLAALEAAVRSGVPRVSADFIFGVANQSPEAARREAKTLAEVGTTHLSAYALTIEPGTQFGALARRGKLPLLDDGAVAESFIAVEEEIERAGFEHYEISNFARGGDYSIHNLGYWEGRNYLGLGAGAWGTLGSGEGRVRYRNTPSPERYLASSAAWSHSALDAEDPLIASYEPIAPATALSERILLGLRLARGLDFGAAASDCGAPAWTPARSRARDELIRRGRLAATGSVLAIPKAHWLFSDGIIRELI